MMQLAHPSVANRTRGALGLKTAMEQSTKKPVHETVARRASSLRGNVSSLLGDFLSQVSS